MVVNFYDAGDADLRLRDGREVKLHIDSAYPADGNIAITVNPAVEGEFTLKFRQPEGCGGFYLHSNFTPIDVDPTGKGYLSIKRTWKPSDKLELALNVEPRIIIGDHKNAGKVAVMAGPLVLAADDELLNGTGLDVEKLVIEAADPTAASFERQPAPPKFRLWPKTCVLRLQALARDGRIRKGLCVSDRPPPGPICRCRHDRRRLQGMAAVKEVATCSKSE